MTKLLGVIGDPISHSLSPLIHNGWLRRLGIPASYEAMQVKSGDLAHALNVLADKGAIGVNVTLPHKLDAAQFADSVSERVKLLGAANTLTLNDDSFWYAENTDVPGFQSSLRDLFLSAEIKGKKAVLLGAGGSARAVLLALIELGVEVVVLNRTEAKAANLVSELGDAKSHFGQLNQYTEHVANSDFVINTTSGGYSGEVIKLGDGDGRLFYDISYGKPARAQLSHARSLGWNVSDGLSMLVGQAAESFEIWFDHKPDREEALQRCRNALEATL